MKALKKNDKIELTIDAISSEGTGIGRYETMAVFVADTVTGDKIIAHIIKTTKNYAVGIVDKIIEKSKNRIVSDCPVSKQCGGCVYRSMTYEEELSVKWKKVSDAIKRIAKLDVPVNEIIGCENTLNYRNKCQYPVGIENGELKIGFYANRSHRIVKCEDCLLQSEDFAQALKAVKEWILRSGVTIYDEKSGKGTLRHIYLRKGFATGEIMLCLVINASSVPKQALLTELVTNALPNIKSIVLNFNTKNTNVILGKENKTIYGSDTITDVLLGMKYVISPNSFYQVNHDQTEKLYSLVKEICTPTKDETVVDIYCGAGTIGLTMANDVKQLIGIEIVPQAIENAKINAQMNGVTNAQFFCMDAAQGAKELEKRGIKPDTVIVDPPRKGCDASLIETIANMSPKKIAYVSCDPATLARDLARFDEKGYKTQSITPVDMFPRTAHVETVVLLSKGEVDSKKIRVEFSLEDMDMSEFQDGATYPQIKEYVLEHTGLKVSNLYISQIKRKCGIEVGKNYNLPKSEDSRQPQCPPEKEKAIREAFKYFGMI